MSTMSITPATMPERSLDQRMQALQLATWTRSKRADFKRDLKGGRQFARAALAAPPSWMDTMKVYDLLLAMPRVGRVKVLKWLKLTGVSPSKTVGGLSPRQREALVDLLVTREHRG